MIEVTGFSLERFFPVEPFYFILFGILVTSAVVQWALCWRGILPGLIFSAAIAVFGVVKVLIPMIFLPEEKHVIFPDWMGYFIFLIPAVTGSLAAWAAFLIWKFFKKRG